MTAHEIGELFAALELRLIASLRRNLNRHKNQEKAEGGQNGVPENWEMWQAAKLRDIAHYRAENKALLSAAAPTIDAESRALLREQYAEGGSEGFFATPPEKLNALLNEMGSAEIRAEKACLRYMDDVYRKTIRGTALGLSTGSMTLQQATDAAVKDFLTQGINCIEYQNGRRVNIATYAEMALRTNATRAAIMGEAAQRERLGIDTVLVSQYGACSKTCLPWQGIVYIDDVWQRYTGPQTPGGTYGISRNGGQYPLLSVALKGGLFHPNCRHTLTTFVEGTSTRPKPMDKARCEAVSALEAKQRTMEIAVRRAKRMAEGLSDPDAVRKAKAEVRAAQKRLREFVEEHGDVLRRDLWRESTHGVGSETGTTLNDWNGGLEYKKVTDASIERVRVPEDPLFDEDVRKRLETGLKELLREVKRITDEKTLGKEVAQCYTMDGTPIGKMQYGKKPGQVKIPAPEAPNLPYIAAHNHASGLSFSPVDIQQFITKSNMNALIAIGNNGKVYMMVKRPKCNITKLMNSMVNLQNSIKNIESDADKIQKLNNFYKEAKDYGLIYYS